MRSALWIAASAILVAQCAIIRPGPEAFAFGVMGDTPYNAREEVQFVHMLDGLGREKLAFVVHVGDFKAGGNSPCTDELFLLRKAQFDRSAHPFVYTPGDNDWTDCRRKSNGGGDPIERLDAIRRVFFSDGNSLGVERMATDAQTQCLEPGTPCACGPFPENRLWEHRGVVFGTINVQGSNKNR